MKKFLLRTLMSFSIIFIFLFISTMFIEYKNKDSLKEKVNVEMSLDKDGRIIVPDNPDKVAANYEFSKFYFSIFKSEFKFHNSPQILLYQF